MNRSLLRSAGFTIIELSLVLVVLGILAVVLVPMAQVLHQDTMNERDQSSLEVARDALLGYIRVNGGVPCASLDATGTPQQITPDYSLTPPAVCDPTVTLDLLGVRSTDARNMTFAYDVNETLTVKAIEDSGNSLCTALANIVNPPPSPPPPLPPVTPPPVVPQVCEPTNAAVGSTACTPDSSMAFVLVGRGSDRCLNLENTHGSVDPNDSNCNPAVAENRVFENPARIHDRDDHVESGSIVYSYYDDLVYTVSLFELAEAMGCPIGGGSGGGGFAWCADEERYVQINNGDASANKCIEIDDGVVTRQFKVLGGTTGGPGCLPDGYTLTMHNSNSCSASSEVFSDTVKDLDEIDPGNNDGRVDILCDSGGGGGGGGGGSSTCTYR
jgi:prepilin-type N-terminal cleavage/methylation domain-containing protein